MTATQTARHFTIDLTAASGCCRIVLASDAAVPAAHLDKLRALVAFIEAADYDDGSITFYGPGSEIPSDDEFEAVNIVSSADAIRDVREWYDIEEVQVAPVELQRAG